MPNKVSQDQTHLSIKKAHTYTNSIVEILFLADCTTATTLSLTGCTSQQITNKKWNKNDNIRCGIHDECYRYCGFLGNLSLQLLIKGNKVNMCVTVTRWNPKWNTQTKNGGSRNEREKGKWVSATNCDAEGDFGHEGGLCEMGSGGEQGRFEDKGGVAISAHLLPHGDTGGIGLHGFLGGGEAGGSGPLILLLSSADCVAGNPRIAALICVPSHPPSSDALSFKICSSPLGWISKVQLWFTWKQWVHQLCARVCLFVWLLRMA